MKTLSNDSNNDKFVKDGFKKNGYVRGYVMSYSKEITLSNGKKGMEYIYYDTEKKKIVDHHVFDSSTNEKIMNFLKRKEAGME